MARRDIRYVCFHFTLDGEDYADDMGQSITPAELYTRMMAGAEVKTCQVPVADYARYFAGLLDEGLDVLHVAFSGGLSGSVNAARLAAEEVAPLYPDRRLMIVDSLGASAGYGLIMETLADMRDEGMALDALRQWVEDNRLRMHSWFYSTDLSFCIRGGRISKTAGMAGTLLNICPLLNMDAQGKLKPREKLRGNKKVMQRIVEMMEAHAEGGLAYRGKCYICHSMCDEDARAITDAVEARFPNLREPVGIYPIRATIGSHTGPGTLALFFWGDERTD